MSKDEYDSREMLKDIKGIFTSYQEREQQDLEGRNDGCLAISGTYELNRILKDKVYQKEFHLGIVMTELIPHVYLLNDMDKIKESGFHHFYEGGRCCLGTDVAILLSWGREYDTAAFFEDVVDPFLINTLSYVEKGVAVMGELGHGSMGMEEYYCSLFGVDNKELRQTIPRVFSILFNRRIPDGQMCTCRRKTFSDCDCAGKGFLSRAIKDQTLTRGFYNDMRSIPWVKGMKYRRR